MIFDNLKEKVGALEKTLLAIDELNNICQQAICNGGQAVNLECCANVLNYLIEPAMLQVEALRMQIGEIAEWEGEQIAKRRKKCS